MIQDITPHTYVNAYWPQPPCEDSYILYFRGKQVLIRWQKGRRASFPRFRDLEPYNEGQLYDTYIYLFSVDGQRYYLLDNIDYPMDENYSMEHVEIFRKERPDYLDFVGITGYQLHSWYRSRRFCGVCGKPMVHSDKERMVYCVSCKQMEYPKICPAVIVGIVNGDKILMSTYANSSKTSYALIAGFAEIGETIEDTVRREVMEEVGLGDRLNNFPAQLSGGEQQRVSIARALAKNPKLLLCDEPTGALDYNTGKSILKLLQNMCRERGMTVIVITHNQALAPMADRLIHIKNGQVSRMETNEHPMSIDEIEW